MSDKSVLDPSGTPKLKPGDVIRETINILVQRKSALKEAYISATNPLDRLSYKDRMDEIDNCLRYLNVQFE